MISLFDWISDAIDWIGDGISSLWDSTIGGAVDAISDVVWDIMFEWLFNKVYGAVAELFMFIDQSATDLFSLAWVRTFVSLFQALGWMLLSAVLSWRFLTLLWHTSRERLTSGRPV